jgi:hypothetical protein
MQHSSTVSSCKPNADETLGCPRLDACSNVIPSFIILCQVVSNITHLSWRGDRRSSSEIRQIRIENVKKIWRQQAQFERWEQSRRLEIFHNLCPPGICLFFRYLHGECLE